ncbi:MAG: hypothetical protein ABI775_01630, partial [Pseudonocardiales bacterium]
RLPVVLFAEGGGGRPGDTDMPIVAGLHVGTFASFARLNGQVPGPAPLLRARTPQLSVIRDPTVATQAGNSIGTIRAPSAVTDHSLGPCPVLDAANPPPLPVGARSVSPGGAAPASSQVAPASSEEKMRWDRPDRPAIHT